MKKLEWITSLENLNKAAKGLFLGSFTSEKGIEAGFYYASSYNQFYKILSFVLYKREFADTYKDKGANEINEFLKNEKLIVLIEELRKNPNNKDETRALIRKELAKFGFEICDLFVSVKKKSKSSLDSKIDISNSKRTNLIELFNKMIGLETIYCTSKFVEDNIPHDVKKYLKNRNIKVVLLESPSPSRRIKINAKVVDWVEKIQF